MQGRPRSESANYAGFSVNDRREEIRELVLACDKGESTDFEQMRSQLSALMSSPVVSLDFKVRAISGSYAPGSLLLGGKYTNHPRAAANIALAILSADLPAGDKAALLPSAHLQRVRALVGAVQEPWATRAITELHSLAPRLAQ